MTDEFNETLEQLELLIGKENARKVAGFFEGMNIYFPKSIGLGELHGRIYEDLRNGATYREAAAKYGYTKSYIRKIERKITDMKRRERREQQPRKPENKDTAVKPGAVVRPAPRGTAAHGKHVFLQGELF
jgi:hypothetical protein